jgi:hypothetical protein
MSRWLTALGVLLLPATLLAGMWDIDANRFYTLDAGKLTPDKTSFQKVLAEIGVATSPKLIGPAHTLGILGFDVGYAVALTNVNETAAYWRRASDKVDSFIPTMQVNLTKGLPYSFQLEGLINHMFKSSVWGVGLNLKWAAVEGYRYLPEVCFAGHVGTLMGTEDYTLLTFGGSALVSKTFGIAGILALAPYVGYHAVAGRGASEVLYRFEGNDLKTFVISPFIFLRNFGVVGLTIKGGVVAFGVESMFTGGLQSFSFKGSVNF